MAQFFSRLLKRDRLLLWVTTILLLAPIVGSNYQAYTEGRPPIPFILAIVGTLMALGALALNQRTLVGIILLAFYADIAFFSVSQVFGAGVFISAAFLILGIGLTNYYLPGNRMISHPIIVAIAAAITLFDILGPDSRNVISNTGFVVTLLIGAATLFGTLIYIARAFYRFSVFNKLLATIALLLVSTGGATLAVNFYNQRNFFREQITLALQSQARFDASLIGQVIADDVEYLANLGQVQTLQTGLVVANVQYSDLTAGELSILRNELEDIERSWVLLEDNSFLKLQILNREEAINLTTYQSQNVNYIQLVDEVGKLILTTEITDRYFYGNDDFWDDLQDGRTYVGDIAEREEGIFVYTTAVPVRDTTTNEFLGAVIAEIELNQIDLLQQAGIDLDDSVSVNLVFSPTGAISNAQETNSEWEIVASDRFTQFMQLSEMDQVERLEVDGVNYLVVAEPISEFITSDLVEEVNWFILIYQSEFEALGPILIQQTVFVGLGVLVLGAGLLLASITARAIARPIRALESQATRFAQGDYSIRVEPESEDEIGNLAIAFNGMAGELETLIASLEDEVKRRTQALRTTFRVSRSLTSIVDQRELAKTVVKEIKDAFDYYHVHIYLYDRSTDLLNMVEGSGEIGERLLQLNHRLRMGQGLVGRAASTNSVVLVPDVTADPNWLPNRLLPETKSEIAVPIALGEEVLGVIDVQDNVANRLDEEDAELLVSIAGQTAVALRNANLYAKAQSEADRQVMVNRIREKILMTQSIEEALKTTVKELGRELNVSEASIQLGPSSEPMSRHGNQAEDENGFFKNGH